MAQDPLIGRTLADRFEILERIGEGGTGVVYRAKQLSVDRIIAIKVLGAHVSTDPSWVKRFHNEARAASRLDHPNTVRIIDFGQTKEGLLFIAMEFLHGRSLRQEIERCGRLPPNRVLRIVSQTCASLHEAHGQGIIHRDIKPDNIHLVEMKGAGDFVKVLDFSVAKLDAPDAQVTRAGVVFGTPAYMSPEQGRGIQLDARSDIYAVGIVAYEMLTGKPPFDAKLPTEVVMMHLREQPPPLTGVPPQLASIVMRALSKDPAQRQQSADLLDQECQACFAELFPRQTPGHGSAPVVMPPLGHAHTMPVSSTAIGNAQTMAHGGGPIAGTPEQKTVMAGMPAPVLPTAPTAPTAQQEQKTMMAGMPAPVLPAGGGVPLASAGPPPPAPPPSGGMSMGMGPPASAASEQKTVMAGMEAPVLPPNTGQKTQAPQPAGGLPHLGAGTQLLPDSAGVVAYAREQAAKARDVGTPDTLPAPPASPMFWLAWVVIGIGLGIGAHFFLISRGI